MVDPALARLLSLLRPNVAASAALGAVKDILDRNGLKPPDRHELSGKAGGPVAVNLIMELHPGPPVLELSPEKAKEALLKP